MTYKKTVLYILIATLLVLGSGLFLINKANHLVPSTMNFTDFGLGANSLCKGGFCYKNQTIIKKYFELNMNKEVRIVSLDERRNTESIFGFSYNSDKGRDSFIDDKGRIYFIVPKSELRNKSILHWLWWKLDSDPASSIYYATDPDPKVAELANQINKEFQNK